MVGLVNGGNVHPLRRNYDSHTSVWHILKLEEVVELLVGVLKAFCIHLSSIDEEDTVLEWKLIKYDHIILSGIKLDVGWLEVEALTSFLIFLQEVLLVGNHNIERNLLEWDLV